MINAWLFLTRLTATARGLAMGVMLLLFAAAAFPALHAHEVRAAWTRTSAQNLRPAEDPARTSPLLWRLRTDYYKGQPITRVDVAALGPRPPLPPGLDRLPGPGQVVLSPGLVRLVRSAPPAMLGDRFPGRVVATDGPAGLVSPGQLVVFVGHPPAALRAQSGVITVRSMESAPPGLGLTATGFLRIMVVIGIAGLLVPVAVFVSTATRLAAARREQRLAALRLAGATPRQTAAIAAIEAALAAVAGTAAGFAAFALLRPSAARIPIDGSAFFPADLRLTAIPAALIALGVPALATVAALMSLRRVRVSPLGVTRHAPQARPTWRRLIPLATGLAAFGAALTLVMSARGNTNTPLLAVGAAFVLVIAGIVVAGPLLTAVVAGLMSRLGRRAPALLAARHLQDDPVTGFRAISGLVLATFVATVISGVLPAALSSYQKGYAPFPRNLVAGQFIGFNEPAMDPTSGASLLRQLNSAPGVTAVSDLRVPAPGTITISPGGASGKNVLPLLAPCASLRAAHLLACPAPADAVAVSGGALAAGTVGGPAMSLPRPVPATILPSRPLAAVIVSTSGTAAAMERVRTIIDTAGSRWDPLAVTSADIDSQNRQRLARLEQLANAALLVTLVIAGCSLTVAVSGGLIERKRPFALLRLTGVRMTDLTRVVLAEAAIPLLSMTALSVILGLAVAAALLLAAAKGSVIIAWQLPGAGYWGALAAGIVLALLTVAATLPLLRQLTTLETARFE